MKRLFLFVSIMTLLVLTGCKTREHVVYMQDVPMVDSTFAIKALRQGSGQATSTGSGQADIRIRPGDKLSIIVNTSIPEMATTFNLAVPYHYVGSSNVNSYSTQSAFYTVDANGEIDFPVLGNIKVEGMTRTEIAKDIKARLLGQNLLKDAVVTVDYGNLTFSVLGEVTAPGRYNFDKDNITILEAISMAKDLTITGRRDNVLVTRTDEQGNQHTYRVDLRDTKSIYASPVYNVQQNDIIYVEPNSTRTRQSVNTANVFSTPSFWISVGSLLTTITALIIR